MRSKRKVAHESHRGIAVSATAAPDSGADVKFLNISKGTMNAAGDGAFVGTLSGPGPAITGTNFSAIYTGTHGALAVAVRSGQTATNANGAVFFGFPPGLQLNNEGRFILPCTLTGNGVTANSSNAFYAVLPGALQLVARQGSGAGGKLYAGGLTKVREEK